MKTGTTKFCAGSDSVAHCLPRLAVAAVLLLVGMVAFSGWLGYHYGIRDASPDGQAYQEQVRRLLDADKRALAAASRKLDGRLDALALRLGTLQAEVMRLDAVGERLVRRGGMDPDEFNFSAEPARGGGETQEPSGGVSAVALVSDVDRLAGLLRDRSDKLSLLEQLLLNKELQTEVLPSGRPVDGGWVSARFGMRTDPFDGKRKFHHGIDFAAKPGTRIRAVASGVVVRSGPAPGFGNLVEIKHGNGLVTRYAHCQETLANVGDVVKRGQVIARVGSTGRSTGPHLHFEVLKDGRPMDPARYVSLKKATKKG
ncbi:MAG TPA: M23 family metallopeptidase [Chromatiaceae bacterium]|nr:M23 family metallopeptidase [Chromatiaceae bacterium]